MRLNIQDHNTTPSATYYTCTPAGHVLSKFSIIGGRALHLQHRELLGDRLVAQPIPWWGTSPPPCSCAYTTVDSVPSGTSPWKWPKVLNLLLCMRRWRRKWTLCGPELYSISFISFITDQSVLINSTFKLLASLAIFSVALLVITKSCAVHCGPMVCLLQDNISNVGIIGIIFPLALSG